MNFLKLAAEQASGNRNREFIQLFSFSQNINLTVLLGFLESSKTTPLLIPLKGKKLPNYFNISAAVNTALQVFFTTVAFFPNNFFKVSVRTVQLSLGRRYITFKLHFVYKQR